MNGNIGRRTGALLLLMLVYVLIASTPVSAYNYTGYKWAGTSTTYAVDSSIPSDWYCPVKNAANAWNAAGSKFRFKADWLVNKLYKTALGTKGPVAKSTTKWNTLKIIYWAKTEFNSDLPWSTSGQSGKYDVQNAATHELGHWLRLGDLSGGSDSEKTMYYKGYTGETKKRTLEADDKSGIKYIYGT